MADSRAHGEVSQFADAVAPERRKARNGSAYTVEEFQQHSRDVWEDWAECAGQHTATDQLATDFGNASQLDASQPTNADRFAAASVGNGPLPAAGHVAASAGNVPQLAEGAVCLHPWIHTDCVGDPDNWFDQDPYVAAHARCVPYSPPPCSHLVQLEQLRSNSPDMESEARNAGNEDPFSDADLLAMQRIHAQDGGSMLESEDSYEMEDEDDYSDADILTIQRIHARNASSNAGSERGSGMAWDGALLARAQTSFPIHVFDIISSFLVC